MWKVRIFALVLLVAGFFVGWFIQHSQVNPESKHPFQLGLDLSGGSYLVYKADVSGVDESEVRESMESLRDVIERRVNLFGVSEPSVQTEVTSFAGEGKEQRLVIELPGVTDIDEAVAMIGQTPLLEFKTERPEGERADIIAAIETYNARYGLDQLVPGEELPEDFVAPPAPTGLAAEDPYYIPTELTGRFLSRSSLEFSQGAAHGGSGMIGEPIVALQFNKEGGALFQEITGANVGKTVAIYLDGAPISTPNVNQEIIGGEAVIIGNFTAEEAKQLVGRLNSGALPVPIELISTQSIGPSLGADAAAAGVKATLIGFILVAAFLIIWYRAPGLLAAIALVIYGVIMLALFKLIPVTLTSAGIAGFIISLGVAVDANVLIFERLKEELRAGRTVYDAAHEGFKRAWSSIRDANISSIISAVILFWFGSSLIKGFALTFGLGVIISMLTAITVTRLFLYAVSGRNNSKILRWLYSAGLASGKLSGSGDALEEVSRN